MALPDIILEYPKIIVSQTTGTFGVEPFGLLYGRIEAVYSGSDISVVDNITIFDPTKGREFLYGSTIYWEIDEGTASLTEIKV